MPSRCWIIGTRRFGQQAGDQALAAARHDDIDEFAHGDQLANGGAVGGVDDLHGIGRQAGGLQTFLDQRRDGAVGADRFRAAAQDGGVAGFQAQRCSVGRDVRAGFVNDADDAERDAHLADLDAGRLELEFAHFTDRIGQRGDLLDAFGHAVDTFFGQRQAIEHGGFQPGGAGGGQVFLVGGDQRSLLAADGGGNVRAGRRSFRPWWRWPGDAKRRGPGGRRSACSP